MIQWFQWWIMISWDYPQSVLDQYPVDLWPKVNFSHPSSSFDKFWYRNTVMTLKRKPLPAPPPMGNKPLPKLPDTPKVAKPLPPPPPTPVTASSIDEKIPRKSISMPDVGIPEGAEFIPPPGKKKRGKYFFWPFYKVVAMTMSLDKLPPPPPQARPPRPPPPKAKSINLVNPGKKKAREK